MSISIGPLVGRNMCSTFLLVIERAVSKVMSFALGNVSGRVIFFVCSRLVKVTCVHMNSSDVIPPLLLLLAT